MDSTTKNILIVSAIVTIGIIAYCIYKQYNGSECYSHAHLQEFHKPHWELVNLENDYLQPYMQQYFPYTKSYEGM